MSEAPMLRRHAARLLACGVIAVLFLVTQLPELSVSERNELADRFAFSATELPEWPQGPFQTRRPSNPALEGHSGWMSSVGAAVAMADLDADGLPNDLCQVDPRTDRVTVFPVPGTGDRYAMFELTPVGLPYDRRVMAPMGCIPSDLNEDGRLDVLVYYWGRTPVLFLHRVADGETLRAESYLARELTPSGARWYTNAATFADLDGDGHLDLIVGNYFQDGARILDESATAPDSMQHSMSRAFNGGRNRVLLWQTATSGPDPSAAFVEVDPSFDSDCIPSAEVGQLGDLS